MSAATVYVKLLAGYKAMAEYVSRQTGCDFSANAARHACRRKRDPIPAMTFNGRAAVAIVLLDQWISRQIRRRAA